MKLRLQHSIPVFGMVLMLVSVFGCSTVRQPAQPETQEPDSEAAPRSPYDLERPVPNDIDFEIPYPYKHAIRTGTRTATGRPGPEYWQQRVDYRMNVELIPEQKRVEAGSRITYYNNSPDTLGSLMLELAQNLHAEGVPRKENVEITGGIELKSVQLGGKELGQIQYRGQSGYLVDATRLYVDAPEPIAPGSSVTIEIEWAFKVPQRGMGQRMGYNQDNLFFIAYWYPQVAVYDDVFGWFTDVFTGNAEFYHEFGEYNVQVTAPEQWLITATGELQNPGETLSPPILKRWQAAQKSDSVITIAGEDDFGRITQQGENGKITWSFQADKVQDFAFSATSESIWEGARTPVGDLDGDGGTDYSFVDAVYRPSASKWTETVRYAQHAISFLSDFTGIPYPWPHMTSVEGGGIIGGGMEFPMMTLMGSYAYSSQSALYHVTVHEFSHMWIPMIVSTNERRFSWMDEGTTTFNENQARKDFFPKAGNPDVNDFGSYTSLAGTYLEGPIMRWSDFHYPGPGYGTASYPKPATGLVILRNLLGEETFMKAYRTFMDSWKYKHPYPWDMFHTFESVSGRDLDWFWRGFYYETWFLDQAVAEVASADSGTRIVVEDRGQLPMPAQVVVRLKNGERINRSIDVETWLGGATSVELTVDASIEEIAGVEIDPNHRFPDVNRSNNSWTQQ